MTQDLTPNSRPNNSVAAASKVDERVQKISNTIDNVSSEILDDLSGLQTKLDSLIDIMEDRMVQSTEPAFPIALARLGELRVDTVKKKIEVLKTLANDKATDLSLKKKTSGTITDLESILSGAAMGAALGASVGSSRIQPQYQPALPPIQDVMEILAPTDVEIVNTSNHLEAEDIQAIVDKQG